MIAYNENSILEIFDKQYYILLGMLSAIFVIFPRLVMHKKIGMEKDKKNELKDRKNFGVIKTIIFNLTSVNGIGFLIFVLCYIFKVVNIATILFCVMNLFITVGSLYKLLRKGE